MTREQLIELYLNNLENNHISTSKSRINGYLDYCFFALEKYERENIEAFLLSVGKLIGIYSFIASMTHWKNVEPIYGRLMSGATSIVEILDHFVPEFIDINNITLKPEGIRSAEQAVCMELQNCKMSQEDGSLIDGKVVLANIRTYLSILLTHIKEVEENRKRKSGRLHFDLFYIFLGSLFNQHISHPTTTREGEFYNIIRCVNKILNKKSSAPQKTVSNVVAILKLGNVIQQ